MRNLLIACNADNVSNIPLGELYLKIKKWRQVLKLCLPTENHKFWRIMSDMGCRVISAYEGEVFVCAE
jgi:hypothetical protein